MADEVWEAFRRTNVRVHRSEGDFDVQPTATGDPGAYLPGATGPIHVLTGHNPMGLAASEADNRAANRRLTDDLAAHDALRVWPATGYGGGPIGSAHTWQEASFAVEGLTRDEAVGIATRHDQRAIFEWLNEPGGFRLVACDGSADEPRGWRGRLIAAPEA